VPAAVHFGDGLERGNGRSNEIGGVGRPLRRAGLAVGFNPG
jgi:hypothetical protein